MLMCVSAWPVLHKTLHELCPHSPLCFLSLCLCHPVQQTSKPKLASGLLHLLCCLLRQFFIGLTPSPCSFWYPVLWLCCGLNMQCPPYDRAQFSAAATVWGGWVEPHWRKSVTGEKLWASIAVTGPLPTHSLLPKCKCNVAASFMLLSCLSFPLYSLGTVSQREKKNQNKNKKLFFPKTEILNILEGSSEERNFLKCIGTTNHVRQREFPMLGLLLLSSPSLSS